MILEFFEHNMAIDYQELIHCEHVLNRFTVVCSVTWPLNGSEVGGDLVLIKTSLFCCVNQVIPMLTRYELMMSYIERLMTILVSFLFS